MNNARRDFLKGAGAGALVLSVGGPLFLTGCPTTVADWLQEADNIITLIAPLGDGALAIVGIADPALALTLSLIGPAYDKAVQEVEKFLGDEAAALKAAQPGAVNQLKTFVNQLKSEAAGLITGVGGVTLQPYAAEISNITNAIAAEITAIATVIPALTSPNARANLKALPPVRTAKQLRGDIVAHLKHETGDTKLDATRAQLQFKLESLRLK